MEEQQLSEEQIREIKEINEKIKQLHDRVKANYEDLVEEVEYRRSLGEDIWNYWSKFIME